MNKIIFSEKSSLSLKNKSLATCQYAAVFLKGILLLFLLAMFYLILLPVLAKAGLVPFHYEYTDNYHQFLPGQMHGVQDSPCPLIYQARLQIL